MTTEEIDNIIYTDIQEILWRYYLKRFQPKSIAYRMKLPIRYVRRIIINHPPDIDLDEPTPKPYRIRKKKKSVKQMRQLLEETIEGEGLICHAKTYKQILAEKGIKNDHPNRLDFAKFNKAADAQKERWLKKQLEQ